MAPLSGSYVMPPPGWSRPIPSGSARSSRAAVPRARRHRGGVGLPRAPQAAGRLDAGRGSTWWAPTAVGWWIGVLFAIGSVCFAVGAMPGYVGWVGTDADAHLLRRLDLLHPAAYLQYLETLNAPHARDRAPDERLARSGPGNPGRIDWSAGAVQLVGTVFFNVTTFAAIDASLDTTQAHRQVWVPDMVGSICFLVASGLAWFEVGHGWWSWRPGASRGASPR